MSKTRLVVCAFSTTDRLSERTLTYDILKAAVVEAGWFSAFEASTTRKRGVLFTRLVFDPDLEVVAMGYPWTRVSLKKDRP